VESKKRNYNSQTPSRPLQKEKKFGKLNMSSSSTARSYLKKSSTSRITKNNNPKEEK
jgi:hypothetical protein